MLFLENPENKPALWNALLAQLEKEKMCFLIADGVVDANAKALNLDQSTAKTFIDKIKKSEICRISSNRGQAISPHIAGFRKGNSVVITELITYPSDNLPTKNSRELQNDLESIVINLFYAGGNTESVLIPSNLEPWVMKDVEVQSTEEGLVFKKIASTVASQL
jgi:hypothetical protein